ncbi:glutamate--cysteine ligase [Kitasatospora arboriphila]|uniref:Putative glutamate--cysteine ligase 2 n=1 Tax=Kitasatospora arboriphila TaxID=258052 RepID=A0ABN1TNV8_9ACTN
MLTIGVEEEYLLVSPATGVPVARAARVLAEAGLHPAVTHGEVQRELLQAQLEVATPVCRSLDELGGHLLRLRHCLTGAAEACGCRLAACGSAPFTDRLPVPVTPSARYRRMRRDAPALTDEQLINGMHVHVGVPGRAEGVAVLNGLRPWLPVLTALGANSPLWRGRDTGFASWRTVVFGRWPVSGVPPSFADGADYDRRIHRLVATGLIRDTAQVYWQARLSERYPTVEVRTTDVQLRADEAVLLAGLVRALAARALDPRRAAAVPPAPPELLQTAAWYAARHGLAERLPDPVTGNLVPAAEAAATLLARVGPELSADGDLERVDQALRRLLAEGNGAVRQRRELRQTGRKGLVRMVTDETAGLLD